MSDDYGFAGKRKTKNDFRKKRKVRGYKKGGQHRAEDKGY
jgi:hypothetical protein